MGTEEVRATIAEVIAKVTKIDARSITDAASFREDLGLDSLSILETLVDVQCRFQLPEVSDEEFASIRTVGDTIRLVREKLCLGWA
jgi:acyl carrier protein